MKPNIEKAINEQINAELYSAYLYYSMAAYFDDINLSGFSNWMKVQAEEEQMHAKKMYDFVYECDGKVVLTAIEAPPTEWNSPLDTFKNVLSHEQHVTDRVNKLVDLAINESDHATNNFLQWFIAEQVEEVAAASGLVKQLEFIQDNPQGIFMLDRELGQRVLPPPAE